MAVAAMRPTVSRILLLVCALLAVIPATAGAATTPKVTSVAPLKLKIGERLTIRGNGFLPGKNRNTVVFKATGARAVFAKAQTATKTKLVVKVPAKLLSFLKVRSGQSVATRFRIRVLARKLSPSYTPVAGSPVIAPATATPVATTPSTGTAAATAAAPAAGATPTPTPTPAAAAPAPDCDGDGTPDATDLDDDNDLLVDTVEAAIGTDACNADTDGDAMTDGWEYKSALDLNARSCPVAGDYPVPCDAVRPYPAKRPYPNPRFNDAAIDYDGDSMTAYEEFVAWSRKAAADPAWRTLTNLWYSDGLQASQDTSAAAGCRGMAVPAPFNGKTDYPEFVRGTYGGTLDLSSPDFDVYTLDRVGRHAGDGCLDDAERDEDGDFLTNFDEQHGPLMNREWWSGVYQEPLFNVEYQGTDWLDADTNGDGVIDGLDDQDHDDFLNVEEIVRGSMSRSATGDVASRTGLWVDPFNPCVPSIESRTCPTTLLLGATPYRPFKKTASDTDPTPRWPLYPAQASTWNHYGYLPYDPYDAGTDPDGIGPLLAPDLSTPEVWDPPVGYAPGMPPLHPLPR
jgi:hypothetical protein